MIKLVVSDVDGTMLDETERIPEEIRDLTELIARKNVLFTIASGREYSQVKELEKLLNIRIPIIMCNGTAARHKDHFLWCETIDHKALRQIVTKADAYDMSVVLSMPSGEFAYRKTEFVEKTILQYGRFGNILRITDDDWDNLSVQKILIMNEEEKPGYKEVLELLQTFDDCLTWTDFGTSLDIVPKGCTKASGVIRLSESLGIELSEVMALGDNYNDIEMLTEVGLGVAVNNAVDDLKASADYICKGKYIDGVIEAIDKFC